jgi:hypothetical protein
MEMVRSLAEAGADLEIPGGKYLTKPLGEAVLFGSVEMVEYLISKGVYQQHSEVSLSLHQQLIQHSMEGNLEDFEGFRR